MISAELAIAILTSTVISALLTFLLNYIFENRQKHRYEKELTALQHSYEMQLEKLKSQMAIGIDAQHEIIERRLESYPKLTEIVYRTRNMARDIAECNFSSALVEELQVRTRELEDCLYKFRIDLERDGIFGPVHAYKNVLKAFNLAVQDAVFYGSQADDEERAQQTVAQVSSLYANLETLHKPIIGKLTNTTLPPA